MIFILPILLTFVIIPYSMMGLHKPLGELLSDISERTRVQTDMSQWDNIMTRNGAWRIGCEAFRLEAEEEGKSQDIPKKAA